MSSASAVQSTWLFDVSTRTHIEVTGRDRAKFLHNFCTNDIKSLQPGQGSEAFVTNVSGKVLGHIFVFAEADSVWIESVAGAASSLLPHFQKYTITEDVSFTDRSSEFAEFLLTGERSADLLEQLSGEVTSLVLWEHRTAPLEALIVRSLRRVDWFGSAGWLLLIPVEQRDSVRDLLISAGARSGDESAFQALRIAAAFPIYGLDITEDNLAQEVGRTSQAISFRKGCYLGQEPIARIDALGHVNRQLCRLELSSESPVTVGSTVYDQDDPQAKAIGVITSSCAANPNVGLEKPGALAYLRSTFAKPGRTVFLEHCEAVVW